MNKERSRVLLIISGIILLGIAVWFLLPKENNELEASEDDFIQLLPKENNELEASEDDFIQCFIDQGMVIYGSRTCPACAQLAQELGGYNKMGSLFVECSEESDRCMNEMKTNYVPEIQINGELYQGPRDIESLSRITSCEL